MTAKALGPTDDPVELALQGAITAATALLVLVVLWPPGMAYWTGLAGLVGESPTLATVVVLTVGLGAWFARTTEYGLLAIAVGTGVAYAVGMLAIQAWLAPASPVHLLWYGILAAAFAAGALLWWVASVWVASRFQPATLR